MAPPKKKQRSSATSSIPPVPNFKVKILASGIAQGQKNVGS